MISIIKVGHANQVEEVHFSSMPEQVSPFRLKHAAALGKKVKKKTGLPLVGLISFPDKASSYAAIILLHGCTVESEWREKWKQQLIEWGFAVLSFDAFTPRQIKNTCNKPYDVHPGLRARDIQGAVQYLSKRNDIDSKQIAVLGLTHGAWSILYALTNDMDEVDSKLSAAVAL